jgi:hypothetical protein
MKRLERVFNKIMMSDMFRLDGKPIDLPQAVIDLCDAIKKDKREDEKWHIGEGGECCLDDFIAGAYWSFTEWHGGQYSDTYQALSELGRILNPNMSFLNEDNYGEVVAYEQCNEWFNKKYNKAEV